MIIINYEYNLLSAQMKSFRFFVRFLLNSRIFIGASLRVYLKAGQEENAWRNRNNNDGTRDGWSDQKRFILAEVVTECQFERTLIV